MVVFHPFIVFYEEPHPRKVFGTGYEEYYRNVRRWVPDLAGVVGEKRGK